MKRETWIARLLREAREEFDSWPKWKQRLMMREVKRRPQ